MQVCEIVIIFYFNLCENVPQTTLKDSVYFIVTQFDIVAICRSWKLVKFLDSTTL